MPRPRVRLIALDAVRFTLSADPGGDGIVLEARADYGSMRVPLLEREVAAKAGKDARGGFLEEPDREWDIEREAYQTLSASYPLIPTDAEFRFRVHEEDLYLFAKEILPELTYRYELEIPEALERKLTVRQSVITSLWKVGEGRPTARRDAGWFDFSIDWQCENAEIEREAIEEAIVHGRPYVRDRSGAFIEYSNTDELEELAAFLSKSERQKDGSYRGRLFFAPELQVMLEQSQRQRIEATDRAFETFLNETRVGKAVEPVLLPPHLERVLRPYQKDGVSWLAFLRKYGFGGILADDMGLGKTLQMLSLLAVEKSVVRAPALVVCPKTLLLTWAEESERFTPELKTLVIDGLAPERAAQLKRISQYDLVITSYSTLQRDIKLYTKLPAFHACVLDEAQYIKNSGTATAKAVKLVPALSRVALTGTPLENGVHELWSIFDFLMPGFLGDARAFRSQYERPIKEHNDVQALERLKRRVRPFMLRRTKSSELKDLPPKIEQVSHSTLTPEQLVVYARTLEDVRKEVTKAVAEKGFTRARIEILTALMKLRRVCDHPALVDPRLPKSEELSGKMDQCLELVRQAKEGGHKVLLFSQFTSMLDIIRDALDRQGIGHCTIEGKTRDRDAQVKRFCADPNITVFLLSLRAGGTGLTLVEADTVILFDPWWNPMVERQAMDRAHRIGQTKTVNVYKLVTKGTVEEKVVDLQDRKAKLFEALMEENLAAADSLTWEDVQELFA